MFIGVKDGRAVSVRGNPDHPGQSRHALPEGPVGAPHASTPTTARSTRCCATASTLRTRVGWDDALRDHGARRSATCRRGYGRERGRRDQHRPARDRGVLHARQAGAARPRHAATTTATPRCAWPRRCAGYKRSFGSDGPPGAYEDLEKADVIILIGANIAENHPILCRRLQANPGTTLIVVDPRVTKTAMMADLHLPLKPRSDLALINGLIHVVIEHDLVDRDYIDAHTTGFDALRESVRELHARARGRDHRPRARADRTGPPGSTPTPRPAFIGWTMGVNHSTKGTETVNAINNLALITGNIGRAGAAPFSITGQCNAMGTREAGFASSLPGYRKFESADGPRGAGGALEHRRSSAFRPRAAWRIPTSSRPRSSKRIRALWIIATNPIVSFPNLGALTAGARGARVPGGAGRLSPDADLRVRRTWCCRRRSGARRKAPTPTPSGASARSTARWRRPARRAPTSTSSWALADVLGVRDELFPGWTTPGDAFEEWKQVSAGRLCDYSGMTYERHRAARRHPVAVPGRRHRARATAAPLRRRRRSRPTTAGEADCRRTGSRSPSSRTPSSRSCSTPAAPSSTGTRAPRPARCRSSSGCRRTRGWR